jgi:LysR family transcriptional regulator, regulator for bpeEF and oprC
MDKFKSIEIFIQTVQHRSFSGAARQLGMSPSGVSKAIVHLEEELGVRLLNRTTRSVTPTGEGNIYYERCQQLFNALSETELELSKSQVTPTGTLRIGLVSALGRMHIIPAMTKFADQYPELNIDISLSDRRVDIIESGIDAVVRVGMNADSTLIMLPLATARAIVCASPEYIRHHGIPQTPEDLLNHECINHAAPHTGRVREWTFARNGQEFSLAVRGRWQIDWAEAAIEAAIAGAGFIQFYNFVVGNAISQGLLVPVLEDYAPPGVPITILYAQKQFLPAKVGAFVEFMKLLMLSLKRNQIVD